MNYNSAVKSMGLLELSNNVFMRTFLNTASSTFDVSDGISIWTSNPDILFSDMRNMDKLVLAILPENGITKESTRKRIEMFKDVLSIDFDTDFRVTDVALKIPMIELWSTTQLKDVWIDRSVFNISDEDKGKTIYVPYDYFLIHKPTLFAKESTNLVTNFENVIKVNNPGIIRQILPYREYLI